MPGTEGGQHQQKREMFLPFPRDKPAFGFQGLFVLTQLLFGLEESKAESSLTLAEMPHTGGAQRNPHFRSANRSEPVVQSFIISKKNVRGKRKLSYISA